MSVAPPFQLTHDQAQRLQAYIQTYRQYALATLLPSAERNTMLRVLQTVQGKLIVEREQPAARRSLALLLTGEETRALRKAVTALLTLYTNQPASTERVATLGDLALLKTCLSKIVER